MWQVTCDRWRLTHDKWHMTCDTWHVTHDMWHMDVTCDIVFILFLRYIFFFYAQVKMINVSIKMACIQDLRVWRNSLHNYVNSGRAPYDHIYKNRLWQPVKNNLVMIIFVFTNKTISSKLVTRASMVSTNYNFTIALLVGPWTSRHPSRRSAPSQWTDMNKRVCWCLQLK